MAAALLARGGIRAALLGASLALLVAPDKPEATVPVRHTEGLVHGFLTLRSTDGELLASGDMLQTARGSQVTNHLIFHFKDGSLHAETVVFSQRRSFQLLQYHLVQKGPSFKQPMDAVIDPKSGQVTVKYSEDAKEKTEQQQMEIPPSTANGLALTLLKNLDPATPETKVPMVAFTPKPTMVHLSIKPQGDDGFETAGAKKKATHFVVKIDIGGVKGLVAPLVGKQPPDTHVWILEGEAPAFVKSEGPLCYGCPVWRIELTSPVWPGGSAGSPASAPH